MNFPVPIGSFVAGSKGKGVLQGPRRTGWKRRARSLGVSCFFRGSWLWGRNPSRVQREGGKDAGRVTPPRLSHGRSTISLTPGYRNTRGEVRNRVGYWFLGTIITAGSWRWRSCSSQLGMRSVSFVRLEPGDLPAKNFPGHTFLCAIKKKKIPRINIIRITDVLKLRGYTEHRMHTQLLNVICTLHIRVCNSSSLKATFNLVKQRLSPWSCSQLHWWTVRLFPPVFWILRGNICSMIPRKVQERWNHNS